MNEFERGFREELEKIAISVAELFRAAKRVKAKPFRLEVPSQSILSQFGGIAIPTKATQKHVKKVPKWMQGVPQEIRDAVLVEQARNPGRIYVSPQAGLMLDPAAGKRRQRLLTQFAKLHEGSERAVPAKRIQWSSMHASPEVLLTERNLLQTLKGRGAKGLIESVEGVRAPEYELLTKQLKKSFGPRAVEFLETGRKFPKAMRKAFASEKRAPLSEKTVKGMAEKVQEHLMTRANRI